MINLRHSIAWLKILVPAALLFLLACGNSATSTPESAAAPTAAPQPTAAVQLTTAAQPTAEPRPTAAPTASMADDAPHGTLDFGFKEFGSMQASLKNGTGASWLFVGISSGESLVTVNEKSEFLPELATDWQLSEDSLTWTFTLKEGVQFHKGYGEMTTDDVIWALKGYADPESLNGGTAQYTRLFDNPEGGITKIDDYTFSVNTGTVQYDMLIALAIPHIGVIPSKAAFDDLGEEEYARVAVGTGPWELREAKTGQFWKFDAVEDHHRKTPYFAELVFHEISEESTRLANFQVGELDSFNMALDSKSAVEKVEGFSFMPITGGATIHVGFYGNWYTGIGTPDQREGYKPENPWISSNPDFGSEEWKNAAKVRRALSMAIDRDTIIETLLQGEGGHLLLWGWEGAQHRFTPDMAWEFDPEGAKELLAEAGYPDGFDLTLTPDIRGIPSEVEICEAVGSMWENIGLDVNLNKVAYEVIGPKITSRQYDQINCHGTTGRPEPIVLWSVVATSDAGWTMGFDHPWLDEKLKQAVATVDQEARAQIMDEVGRWGFDNAMTAGLFTINILWPLGPDVDSWGDHVEYGDRRMLSSSEWAPHK